MKWSADMLDNLYAKEGNFCLYITPLKIGSGEPLQFGGWQGYIIDVSKAPFTEVYRIVSKDFGWLKKELETQARMRTKCVGALDD